MSDEKMVSERDAVLRERVAYVHGMIRGSAKEFSHVAQCEDAARKAYPLPKVTQPRVLRDPESGYDQEWRAVDGVLQFRCGPRSSGLLREWTRAHASHTANNVEFPTTRRIAMWADLLANPTEEVDDE